MRTAVALSRMIVARQRRKAFHVRNREKKNRCATCLWRKYLQHAPPKVFPELCRAQLSSLIQVKYHTVEWQRHRPVHIGHAAPLPGFSRRPRDWEHVFQQMQEMCGA